MTRKQIQVFDPALCCPTGVCGPNIDQALIRFAADMEWLAEQGVEVQRFNLAQQPGAFAESDLAKEMLELHGEQALPLIVVDGRMVMSGAYPNRGQLAGWFRLGLSVPADNGCDPKSGCC